MSAQNSDGTRSKLTAPTTKVVAGGPPGLVVLPNGRSRSPWRASRRPPADRRLGHVRPEPVSSRTSTISVRVKVKDTRGYVVRDALVFLRSTPILTSAALRGKTEQDGTVTTHDPATSGLPLRNGYSVQFFVKAYRAGDNPLAGYPARLVQVKTAR
jgi:hypothetical protein